VTGRPSPGRSGSSGKTEPGRSPRIPERRAARGSASVSCRRCRCRKAGISSGGRSLSRLARRVRRRTDTSR
jgi:hypothetical protein